MDTVPPRYRNAVVPHAMIAGAEEAIAFYARAFGAEELFRIAAPDGTIIHAELRIGGSTVMVGDAGGPFGEPGALGGTTVGLHVYVDAVEPLFERALAAGAKELAPVEDMFYGDRTAMLEDPFGHIWVLLERIEDLAPEQIVARAAAALGSAGS